jgi:hypothetical protein
MLCRCARSRTWWTRWWRMSSCCASALPASCFLLMCLPSLLGSTHVCSPIVHRWNAHMGGQEWAGIVALVHQQTADWSDRHPLMVPCDGGQPVPTVQHETTLCVTRQAVPHIITKNSLAQKGSLTLCWVCCSAPNIDPKLKLYGLLYSTDTGWSTVTSICNIHRRSPTAAAKLTGYYLQQAVWSTALGNADDHHHHWD